MKTTTDKKDAFSEEELERAGRELDHARKQVPLSDRDREHVDTILTYLLSQLEEGDELPGTVILAACYLFWTGEFAINEYEGGIDPSAPTTMDNVFSTTALQGIRTMWSDWSEVCRLEERSKTLDMAASVLRARQRKGSIVITSLVGASVFERESGVNLVLRRESNGRTEAESVTDSVDTAAPSEAGAVGE